MLLLTCVATMMPALSPVAVARIADNPVEARREDEAERLMMAHADTWVAEIAGFNRRNTLCDSESAQAAAVYDATHRARFKRTLGWRFDVAGARWMPVAPAEAEVTLIYSGPVHSGTVTVDGRAISYCRAEAPDKIEIWWTKVPHGNDGVTSISSSMSLPALAPGFEAPNDAPPPPASDAPTPRAEIDARIAKAAAMLAQDVDGLDAFLAASRAAKTCTEDKARELARSFAPSFLSSTRTRTDGPVQVRLKSHSDVGPLKLGDRTIFVCGAFSRQATIEATATWQAEGDNELSFTIDAQGKP